MVIAESVIDETHSRTEKFKHLYAELLDSLDALNSVENFRRCFPNIAEYYDMVFDLHSQMILKLRAYQEEEFNTLCREENIFHLLEKIETLCARNGLDSDGNIVRPLGIVDDPEKIIRQRRIANKLIRRQALKDKIEKVESELNQARPTADAIREKHESMLHQTQEYIELLNKLGEVSKQWLDIAKTNTEDSADAAKVGSY